MLPASIGITPVGIVAIVLTMAFAFVTAAVQPTAIDRAEIKPLISRARNRFMADLMKSVRAHEASRSDRRAGCSNRVVTKVGGRAQ
jgi:hypothetical protein